MRVIILSKALTAALYRKKLEELSRLGIEMTAIVPPYWLEGGRRQLLEAGPSDGYRLLVSPPRWNGRFHLHYYPELPRLLNELRPDLLHVDEEPYNLATYLAVHAARRREVPAVFFSWQNIARQYPPPFRWLEQSVYRRSSGAIAGTADVERVLRAKGYTGSLTIAPQFGVDPEIFKPDSPPSGPFRLGFLNRLIPAKAPLQTVAAFAQLPAEAQLVMVGDGPLRTAVQSAIADRGLQNRVTLRTRVPSDQVPALMRDLHALVLPSLTTSRWKEQFGRVLIEAMSSGIPVVGSNSGEIPAVIGDAGIITPEGNVDALAGAFRRLYEDRDLRVQLGQRGRDRVLEHYTNRRVAEQTACAYRQALG